MTHIPNPRRQEFPGGNIGVLVLQPPNSEFSSQLNSRAGHCVVTIISQEGTLSKSLRQEFENLRAQSERIFVAAFGSGALSALSLAEEFGEEIDGLVIIDPITSSEDRTVRKEYKSVFENLDLVEHPLLLMYSLGETGEQFSQAQEIAENISSAYIREVVLDHLNEVEGVDETISFISEVVHRFWPSSVDDDTELIDAEFESIIAGLSLDQSSPSNYLDDLDAPDPDEHFIEPDPQLQPIRSRSKRNAIYAMIVGPIYAIAAAATGFNPLGVEPWPGVIAFFGGLAAFLYTLRDDFTDEDGAVL